MHHDDEDHDKGLALDLPTLLSRRRMLTLLGGASAVALAGCGGDNDPSAASTGSAATSAPTATSAPASASSSDTQIPQETGGPYPADGSNGVNVLTQSGIVRGDIRRSFGSASGVATGVPFTIKLTVLDTKNGSTPLRGAAVYLWHCNINGEYSLYSPNVKNENYLRGVQEANASGQVTYTSIFPACYSGRWPHVHFEVYPSLAKATTASDKLRTSQLALPEDVCKEVYATDGYEQSVSNLAQVSLNTDMVFSDGYSLQLATMTGTVAGGLTATLNVPV